MIRTLVLMKLHAVGLRGARHLMPNEVVRRYGSPSCALARAIALDPLMIMYDEPFTGQDPISKGALVHLDQVAEHHSGPDQHHRLARCARNRRHRRLHSMYCRDGKSHRPGYTRKRLQQSDRRNGFNSLCTATADGPVHFHYPAQGLIWTTCWPVGITLPYIQSLK